MSNNITYAGQSVQDVLITDCFRNQPVSNFCQCGKVLPFGSVACMPDNSAEPLSIAVVRDGSNWMPVLVDPRSRRVITQSRWYDSPCDALRKAAKWSGQDSRPLALDLFESDFDWGVLVAKVSAEFRSHGEKLASAWQQRQANGDKRTPSAAGQHPITVAAFEDAMYSNLVWDTAEFDAHAVAEVA